MGRNYNTFWKLKDYILKMHGTFLDCFNNLSYFYFIKEDLCN